MTVHNVVLRRVLLWLASVLLFAVSDDVEAQIGLPRGPNGAEPVRLEWTIGDLKREAILFVPKDAEREAGAKANDRSDAGRTSKKTDSGKKESESTGRGVPVVFGFHGHGGSAPQAARSFHLQTEWPEALVVYMQGIPTPGRLTDPDGLRNGWQHDAGDHEDRDLKFFDAVLKTIKEKYRVDDRRIYSTGHSNGGAFTYLLWSERPSLFAAMAPCAAAWRRATSLTPLPAMHIAGRNDPLVRFGGQQLTMVAARRSNGCDETGKEWAADCTLYPSQKEAPFVAFIHDGDHKYPQAAPALIVRFFKEHVRAETGRSDRAN